ncbi:TRAP transporter small permease [Kiloniella sp. EL199]|uniref:TRAP transporter small permease n=1 Tax=Kiloniella sp. EL199 TaxID=2107581 RepID=UPI000EA2D2EA|nr:TRAP transporter small permease [Kiloniella sp. EL199]
MIITISKYFNHLIKYVAWVAILFLLGAMLITTVDVVLRKIDNVGIYGTIDLVQLMVMSAAYLSIPYAFMKKSHVAVSILSERMPEKAAALCQALGMVLCVIFMSAIAWFGFQQAEQQHQYGDISITLGLPMIYYWIPVLVGSALSGIISVGLLITSFLNLIGKRQNPLEEEGATKS